MRTTRTKSQTTGFRLDPEFLEALKGRAEILNVSTHDLARQYVMERLMEEDEKGATLNALEVVHKQLLELRSDIALAAEAILISGGACEEDEARKWVQENLERK
jgi:hypothetical protein